MAESIRQEQADSVGWDVVDDDWSLAADASGVDPALTTAAIMKDALAAILAQANIDQQSAMRILLR